MLLCFSCSTKGNSRKNAKNILLTALRNNFSKVYFCGEFVILINFQSQSRQKSACSANSKSKQIQYREGNEDCNMLASWPTYYKINIKQENILRTAVSNKLNTDIEQSETQGTLE